MRLQGRTTVPGDKSISHRALLISALATGSSEIIGLNQGEDCARTLAILEKLGVRITTRGESVMVLGRGLQLERPREVLNCGNSGTTFRLLAGILAGQDFLSVLDGDVSLRQRPMGRIVDPLRQMGADIHGVDGTNLAPVTIQGGELQGIKYTLPIPSAQVKSALLLAGLQARGNTTIVEPTLSRDHTERMLHSSGAQIERSGNQIQVRGGSTLEPQRVQIPGDFSSAAFLLGAAVALPGSELLIEGVGLNPTRLGFLEALRAMNAQVEVVSQEERSGEPVGDLLIRGSELSALTLGGELIPLLIDEIPILAVLATQAQGTTVIQDAAELRVKESDRLASLTEELTKLGAQITEYPEGLEITGPTKLMGARVYSHGDHRLALALEVASLFSEGQVEIVDQHVGEISFPGFSRTLQQLIVG